MKDKIKCDQCGKMQRKEDTYLFDGQTYCYECGIPLVYALAERGVIFLHFEYYEKECVRVEL